jgi:hypothetical protein
MIDLTKIPTVGDLLGIALVLTAGFWVGLALALFLDTILNLPPK